MGGSECGPVCSVPCYGFTLYEGRAGYDVPSICRSWERRHEAQKLSPDRGQAFSTANKGGRRGGSTVSGSWTSQIQEMPVTLLIWPKVAGYERRIDQRQGQTGALGTGGPCLGTRAAQSFFLAG
ncbi:hypothetical protein L1887_52870 [Cichorium endivia]|nr:hypothetical protein L1887_52870 [Cichorium endivia]